MKRNIIYEKQFEDELKALEPDSERADDLIRGIEWILQRHPRHGTPVSVSDPPLWFVPAADLFGLSYVIYYTYSDKKIYFLSIRVAEEKFMDSGEF